MSNPFLVAYLLIDIFCALFAGIILSKAGEDMGAERQVRTFRKLIGAYLVFVGDDALWIACATPELGLPHWLFSLSCTISAFSVASAAYYWFEYASSRMEVNIRETTRRIIVSQIPLFALAALYISNIWLGWVFVIDEAGRFVQGPLYTLAFICEASYLLPVMYMAARRLRSAETAADRREDLTLLSFIVIPTLGGIFDTLIPGMPVMTPSLFAAILYVFVSLQEARISNDALTALNNRRRADTYLSERIARASEGAGFWFFISDVDSFKQINDQYGHFEGDRALRVMAEALRQTAGHYEGFTARWGGDEFVLVVDEALVQDPNTVATTLQDNLTRSCEQHLLPYTLSTSVGFALCESPKRTSRLLLVEADEMLYAQKRLVHAHAA